MGLEVSATGWVAACNGLFDQRLFIVAVWSGRLKETQVASALLTAYLQNQVSARRSTCSQVPESPRPNGLGRSAVETLSNLIWRDGEPGNVEVAKIHSILAILTAFFLAYIFQNPHILFLDCFFAVPLPGFP